MDNVTEISMSYEERIKQRNRIISKINATKAEVEKYDEIINKIEEEIYKLNEKLENIKNKRQNLTNTLNDLIEELNKVGIPVPEAGNYETFGGLVGMKRDVNLKLIKYISDVNKIRQVLAHFLHLFV
jgi:predicted nuclease with TOPRIM domain